MLLSTFVSNKYKKVLVNALLICGAIQSLYAICQSFSLFNVKQYFHRTRWWDYNVKAILPKKEIWVLGFTNNPNFLGTYMLLCLSYSFGLFIDSKKKHEIIIYALISSLFMFVLLISNASSSVVGLLFVFVYILIYCLKNKNYKKILTIFLIITTTTCLAVGLNKTTLAKDMLKIGKETTELAKGNLDDNYGTKRIYIWKETMKIVPNYIWHGVGIDSFHKAFNGEALILELSNKNILYDKAHNEYLQTLVTQGIFALASYLCIYGYAVFYGIKNSFKYKESYLVLPVIGYLAQAFFNISVIEVAPLFYIALGLCCSKSIHSSSQKEIDKEHKMNLEVMLSIMNLKKEDLDKMNITSKCTVINQCGEEGFEKYKNFYIYSYNELGNSNSRNRGLEHITEDIILLCDDDVVYNKDYEKNVTKEFENNSKADVILFNMYSPNRKKRVIKKRKRLHIYNSLNYASYNIAFRKDAILEKQIKFNTNFGPNAKYNNGTDTMFIVDLFKNKLKIYSSHINLGTVYNKKSTWFNGYNEKFFFNKGALFTAISKKIRLFLLLQYLLRHKDVWKKMKFFKAFKLMLEGSNDYLKNIEKEIKK